MKCGTSSQPINSPPVNHPNDRSYDFGSPSPDASKNLTKRLVQPNQRPRQVKGASYQIHSIYHGLSNNLHNLVKRKRNWSTKTAKRGLFDVFFDHDLAMEKLHLGADLALGTLMASGESLQRLGIGELYGELWDEVPETWHQRNLG